MKPEKKEMNFGVGEWTREKYEALERNKTIDEMEAYHKETIKDLETKLNKAREGLKEMPEVVNSVISFNNIASTNRIIYGISELVEDKAKQTLKELEEKE